MNREAERVAPTWGPAVFLWLASVCSLAVGAAAARADAVSPAPPPGRSAIASAHPAATEAGFEILALGGNAFDAAVAVSAALSVVEPYSSGIGGGGFFLLHRASDGREVFVDARETAPGEATRDMYLDANDQPMRRLSLSGALAAGIPGLPAGLAHVADKYGQLPLSQSLVPAIRLAREGLEVDEATVRRLERYASQGSPSAGFLDVFLPSGEPPPVGESLRQPDLADTLQRLADAGPASFYAGPAAERMVEEVRQAGGIWRLEDLAAYRVTEREPIRFQYGNVHITTAPPPSAGGVALAQVFNMLAQAEYARLQEPSRTHLLVEAMRRAYRDRAQYLGDPDFVPIPMERLMHPWYATGLLASVRMDRATVSTALPGPVGSRPRGADTSHFSVMDKDGNRAAVTQTINTFFGSGFIPPGSGVILNNEMDDFSVKPGEPNAFGLVHASANGIEPGKRMLSSMTPSFMVSDRGLAILGTPGGSRIVTMVLLGALKWIEGADAQGIVSEPRIHHQYIPDSISFEAGALSAEHQEALAAMGHNLRESARTWGNMQAITYDYADGNLSAASDPRRSGGADVRE